MAKSASSPRPVPDLDDDRVYARDEFRVPNELQRRESCPQICGASPRFGSQSLGLWQEKGVGQANTRGRFVRINRAAQGLTAHFRIK